MKVRFQDEIRGFRGVAGIKSFLFVKRDFLNLVLALQRFAWYFDRFSGECSSISQEYPPVNEEREILIYAAFQQAKEKYK